MIKASSKRRVRMAAIGLGLALAVSVIGVPTGNAAKVQAPSSGGDINVGVFDLMLSYCYSPNLANSALGVIKTMYEGLVEKREDGKIVPFLLEAFSSTDNVTWTMKLRPGLKFHNGEAMDAGAAKLNLEALRGTLASVYGLHTLGSAVPFTANIKAVTVVDALTFSVTLWRVQPDFMDTVYASGRFYMRAPAMIKSAAVCKAAPIGTGPFTFVSGTQEVTKVAKNPNYWRKDSAKKALPYLNSITFTYVAEPAQRVNGVKSGKLDAAQFSSASEAQQIVAMYADKAKVQMIGSPDEYYPAIFLNQSLAPFDNVHARLAVSYAYDVNTFYKARNCVKGTCFGKVPTSIVGPKNIMYNTKGFKKYNLANAKKELKAYKDATGKDLEFTLPVAETSTSMANAKAIKQIMAKAGIVVNLNQETGSAIVAKAFPSPGTSLGNPYQALPILLFEAEGSTFTIPFLVSNTAADAGNLMGFSGLKPFYSLLSLTRHTNKLVDKTLFDARATGTKAAFKAATEVVQNEALVIATPTLQYFYGMNMKLKGFDTYILAGGGRGKPMTNAGINWTGVYLTK